MRKQILTGLGVILLGSSMAFAAPQEFRGEQPAPYQAQQQWQGDQNQYGRSRYDQRDQHFSERQREHKRLERARYQYSRARRHRSHHDDDWRR